MYLTLVMICGDRCGKARTLRCGRTPRAYLRVVLGYWRRGAPRSVRAPARLEQDDQQVAELVLRRPGQGQPRGDGAGIGVVRVVVGDRQQVDVVLARHEAGCRWAGIGDDGRVTSAQSEAGAAVPGDLHRWTDANGKHERRCPPNDTGARRREGGGRNPQGSPTRTLNAREPM